MNRGGLLAFLALVSSAARAQAPAPAPDPGRPADLLFTTGPIIAGKSVAWSHAITLYDGDATGFENGRCVFELLYDVANGGLTATPTFENWVRAVPASVRRVSTSAPDQPPTIQPGLTLEPKTTRRVHTKAVAAPGPWALVFHADATGVVPERDELNNEQRINLTVAGACGTMSMPPKAYPTYLAEHVVLEHVRIAGMAAALSPAQELDARRATRYADGKCLFDVSYELKNDGAMPTIGFHSSVGVKSASYQEPAIPPLAPGQIAPVKIFAAFRPGDNEIGILSVSKLSPAQASARNYWSGHATVHGTCAPSGLAPATADSRGKRAAAQVSPTRATP